MGKIKQKKQKKDFQKVKLKVGRKLKKADNVTNASFKSRSIQVSQKLSSRDGTEPSTRKKQNIFELLSQCRHCNGNIRHEAVTGIRELMTSHPEMVTSYMSLVIEKTAELLMDKDPNVRKAVIRLLKVILPKISSKQISPFFPLLCAHLCCAMTHIIDEIQMDSLVILDLLLGAFPMLLIKQSNQVLSNFIDQISRNKGQDKRSRSLSMNPSSKTSSQKWRSSVLNRLHKFISAIRGAQGSENEETEMAASADVAWTETRRCHVQVFPSHFIHQWEEPGFSVSVSSLGLDSSGSAGPSGQLSGGPSGQLSGGLSQFVITFVPLLLECWMEACPAENRVRGSLLKTEYVGLVCSTLSVIQILMDCILQMNSQEKSSLPLVQYHQDFNNNFVSEFPYSIHASTLNEKKGKKEKKDKSKTKDVMADQQVSAEHINLAICDIMSHFLSNLIIKLPENELDWLPSVTSYLTDFLKGKYCSAVGQNAKDIAKILHRLIVYGLDQASLSPLLAAVFVRYKRAHNRSTEKRVYLKFFADLVLQSHYKDMMSENLQLRFLNSLPELLAPAVKESPQMAAMLLTVMKQGSCQRCTSLIAGIEKKLPTWFDPKSGLLAALDQTGQRHLIGLLYSVSTFDLSMMQSLVRFCQDMSTDDQQISFLLTVLHNRPSSQVGMTTGSSELYLRFLLTLMLGVTSHQLQSLQTGKSGDGMVTSGGLFGGYTLVTNCGLVEFERQIFINEVVLNALRQLPNIELFESAILSFLENILTHTSTLPLVTALGVLELFEFIIETSSSAAVRVTSLILNVCLSLVLKSVQQDEMVGEDERNIWITTATVACHVIEAVPDGIAMFLSKLCEVTGTCILPEISAKMATLFLHEQNQKYFIDGSKGSPLLWKLFEKFKTQLGSASVPQWFSDIEYTVVVMTQ